MSLSIRHIIPALTLALLPLAACSDTDAPQVPGPTDVEQPATETGAAFSLYIQSGLDGGYGSRATGADPYNGPYDSVDRYAPGTEYENTINTLNVFLCDLADTDDDGVYDREVAGSYRHVSTATFYPSVPFVATSESSQLYTMVTFDAVQNGMKRVYVGANLSEAMIEAFVNGGPEAVYTLQGNDVVIGNDLADATRGMAFFCTASRDMEVTSTNREPVPAAPYYTFSLRRLAAKILVTAEEDPNLSGYVLTHKMTIDGVEREQFRVNMSEVTYTVNTVNTQTYLLQKTYNATNVANPYTGYSHGYAIDPNWNVAVNIAEDEAESNPYFNSHALKQWLAYSYVFQGTELFQEQRIPPAEEGYEAYSNGFYVAENSFNPNASESGGSVFTDDNAWDNITHVVIRAHLLPMIIYLPLLSEDEMASCYRSNFNEDVSLLKTEWNAAKDADPTAKVFIHTCTTEDEHTTLTQRELTYYNYHGIDQDSYYVSHDNQFYTYGAAKAMSEDYTWQEGDPAIADGLDFWYRDTEGTAHMMEFMSQGYSTYRSFVTNEEITDGSFSPSYWKDSQVYRNTYYILHISMINTPGTGLNPNDVYIWVHTAKIGFTPSWSADVTIDDAN